MSRVGKYMVYNPKAGKPVRYHETYEQAQAEAERLNTILKTDILVLKVVGNMENKTMKILNSELKLLQKRTWEIIED